MVRSSATFCLAWARPPPRLLDWSEWGEVLAWEGEAQRLARRGESGMTHPLFIGVDGGGTACRARLRDHTGAALGEGVGGPANVRLGVATVLPSVLAACRGALRAAGLAE